MKAEEMVDAALAGFDQGEFITIPSLPDVADWDAYETARRHHAARRRGGCMAADGTGATAGDAGDRLSQPELA